MMNLRKLHPIICGSALAERARTTFYLPDKEVEVTIPQTLSHRIVKLCDGSNTRNIGSGRSARRSGSSSLSSLRGSLFRVSFKRACR